MTTPPIDNASASSTRPSQSQPAATALDITTSTSVSPSSGISGTAVVQPRGGRPSSSPLVVRATVVSDPEPQASTVDPELREISARAYHGVHGRTYHGTDESSQASIRQNGFVSDLKTAGGAAAEETSPEHFQAGSLQTARLYGRARSAVTGESPRLVRSIGVPDLDHVETTSRRGGHWYVADDDIPKAHVLPSKKEPISDETAEVFVGVLKHEGRDVSTAVAREELDAVRSDSDDDFKS